MCPGNKENMDAGEEQTASASGHFFDFEVDISQDSLAFCQSVPQKNVRLDRLDD